MAESRSFSFVNDHPVLQFADVPIDWIDFAEEDGELLNPRGDIHNTTDLQESMLLVGQQQAVILRERRNPAPGQKPFVVEDGHRRITALRALERVTVWAEIRKESASGDLLMAMLVSNVRQNYLPSDKGRALTKVIETRHLPLEQVARICGQKTQEAQLLIDLAHAPVTVQKRVDSGEMSLSAFKTLRDKPQAVQEAAAALDKPTVRNVRSLSKLDPTQTVMADLLQQTESSILPKLQEVRNLLLTLWEGLSAQEQDRIVALVDAIFEITMGKEAVDG